MTRYAEVVGLVIGDGWLGARHRLASRRQGRTGYKQLSSRRRYCGSTSDFYHLFKALVHRIHYRMSINLFFESLVSETELICTNMCSRICLVKNVHSNNVQIGRAMSSIKFSLREYCDTMISHYNWYCYVQTNVL